MKKYLHLLEKLGMTAEERTVYVTLLEHPYLTISEIARYTSYHRPSIYRAIASLESEGLVEKSLLEGKRYYYHTTSPEKLREKLNDLVAVADRIIPEMEELHTKKHDGPILSIAEGVEGIRHIHDDIVGSLPVGGEYLCYSSSRDGEEKGGVYVSSLYKKKQKNKEISRKIITNSRERETNDVYRDVVIVPPVFDHFDDDITKIIYGEKVAIIDYNSQTGWIIDDARFARYEEKIFRLLFRLLSKSK